MKLESLIIFLNSQSLDDACNFLTGNLFSHDTYLWNKFLTTQFDYSPWFSLFLIRLMSKVLWKTQRAILLKIVSSKHGSTPFLLLSEPVPAHLLKMAAQLSCLHQNWIWTPCSSHRDNQGEKGNIVWNMVHKWHFLQTFISI